MKKSLILILVLSIGMPLQAKEAVPMAADPALEQRVNQLSEELRCLVCQNQTIADSQAGLAIDLKNQIREQLKQGKTNPQVLEYMVQRYGDFVLYRPPVKTSTWLLWFGPFALLLAAGFVLHRVLSRRRTQLLARPELGSEERARAAALLGEERGGSA